MEMRCAGKKGAEERRRGSYLLSLSDGPLERRFQPALFMNISATIGGT